MMNLKQGLAALALAFAMTALASPSYAQEGGVRPQGRPLSAAPLG